jgi:hypothetical protein
MDFFQSQLCQTVAILPSSIFERSIALVKRLAGSKGLKWSELLTLTKCYSKVAHAFLYTLMDFFQSQTVPKPLLSYLLPFSRTFNCTSKTTGWFTKGAEIPTCTLTKCYSGGILYTLMDFFQSHQTVPKPLLSYLLPFSRTFNCTSKKRLLVQKGWNWSNLPHANKVLLKVAHAFLYTLMDFFQSHQTVPQPLLTFFHFPNVQLH